MRKYLPLIAVLLCSCSAGTLQKREQALESSGLQSGTVVSCSGFKSWPDCYRAAERSCPKGYEVLGQEENIITQGRTLRINCKQ